MNKTTKKMKKKWKYQDGTEDPIFGSPNQLKPNNLGIDVFKNAITTPVPVNPNAPTIQSQEPFTIKPAQGETNNPGNIVPLTQFVENYVDPYGNIRNRPAGNYVNNQGQVNTVANQQQENNKISNNNLMNALRREDRMDNIETGSAIG